MECMLWQTNMFVYKSTLSVLNRKWWLWNAFQSMEMWVKPHLHHILKFEENKIYVLIWWSCPENWILIRCVIYQYLFVWLCIISSCNLCCFLKHLKLFETNTLILWLNTAWRVFHVVIFCNLDAKCLYCCCVQYYFCLYRDKKKFILWKVLWKKYYSSVPSMHQMECIIHWTQRENRTTLLKPMKLEGKDLEVK